MLLPLPPALREAALLPWRVSVAATRTTLALGVLASPDGPLRRPGGYADLLLRVIGERGYAQQLTDLLTDEHGPMRLAGAVNELMAPDRPLGRMLARDGVVDRLLVEGGPVDRLLAPGGSLDRLLAEDGALDQLVQLGATLEAIQPRLAELAAVVPTLSSSADALGRAVGPLGDLAGRFPMSRRKPTPLGP
ncbi:hypothetical protein JOE61_003956 [Nocardioides salarius]|uniref:ABC transporter n=1 Tax=Nocardioides salarius TaxID=374513 RepID=A0ABS2MG27_9ACTN|nr:hypothetical protein [Nocardioides salarius]MBM7510142.1 hypothetical protein [Nocardioides salarius]